MIGIGRRQPSVSFAIAAATKSARSMWPSNASLRCRAASAAADLAEIRVQALLDQPTVSHRMAFMAGERAIDFVQQIAQRRGIARLGGD